MQQHCYNEVADRPEHPLRRFLGKFWGLSAWRLELSIVLSAVLREFSVLVIVSALLVLNPVPAYAQERRAAGTDFGLALAAFGLLVYTRLSPWLVVALSAGAEWLITAV